MGLTFERGNDAEPKGHALLYFRSSGDPEEIWATYLVILPITVDVSKYVPPFLMNQVAEIGPKDLSAFAFPPAPEQVESRVYLESLAEARDDDVVYGGTFNPTDVSSAMMAISETVQQYADAYSSRAGLEHVLSGPDEVASGLAVNEVLYGLMAEGDKLSELTKLVGRLRFALDGSEEALAREAESDMLLLARHLPDNHNVSRLVEAAKAGGPDGTRLAALYLQRCFHLVQEEYVKLGEVESEIRALEEGDQST